jgi:transposase, IS5 family
VQTPVFALVLTSPINSASARRSSADGYVEHVFARQKGPMGLFVRTIGSARAKTKIGLANLLYNMQRMVWLTAQAAPT